MKNPNYENIWFIMGALSVTLFYFTINSTPLVAMCLYYTSGVKFRLNNFTLLMLL